MDNPLQGPLPLPGPAGAAGGFNPLAPPPGSAPMPAGLLQMLGGGPPPTPELPLVLPLPLNHRPQEGPRQIPYKTETNGLQFLRFLQHWAQMDVPYQPIVIRASTFKKGVTVNTLAQTLRGGRAWVIDNCEASDPTAVDIARRASFQERPMHDCVAVQLEAAENPYVASLEVIKAPDFPLLQAKLINWINDAPAAKPDTQFMERNLSLSLPEQQWVDTQLAMLPKAQYMIVADATMILIIKRGNLIAGIA